ncbi:radical SAM protein [Clostridium sp. CTA-19]
MRESIFNIKVSVDGNDYIYNSKNNGIIQICDEDLYKEENVKYLLEEGYYVEDGYDEIALLEKEVNKNIKNEKEELSLTVSLTEKCNFECVYCYQDHKAKDLSIENAEKLVEIVKEMIEDNKFKVLKIHYFGGEPLLNVDMLYYLHDKFKKISKEYNMGYKAYLTTNGSRLNKEILSKVNFKNIQLTFDGLEDTHNKLRKSSMFKFKDTINLISTILEFCDKVTIRFNICEENKRDVIPLIDFLMNKFGSNKINFITARTIKFNEKDKINMISFKEYSELSLKAEMRLKEHGAKIVLPQRVKYPCPFTNGNALSISSDLSLKKCEESEILLEMLSKDSIKKKNEYNVLKSCRKCRILPLCLGGCYKNRQSGYEGCIPEKNNIEDIIINYIKFES